mgnify:CR=1 FL=1
MTLTKESILLIGIATADLATTLLLLGAGVASEGNPLMAYYLKYGIGIFVMVKLGLIFFPIVIAEWSRQYRPKFVRFMLRATIATYLGVYLVMFLSINVAGVLAARTPASSGDTNETKLARGVVVPDPGQGPVRR